MMFKRKLPRKGILGTIATLLGAYGGYLVKGLVGGAIAAAVVAGILLFLRAKRKEVVKVKKRKATKKS